MYLSILRRSIVAIGITMFDMGPLTFAQELVRQSNELADHEAQFALGEALENSVDDDFDMEGYFYGPDHLRASLGLWKASGDV